MVYGQFYGLIGDYFGTLLWLFHGLFVAFNGLVGDYFGTFCALFYSWFVDCCVT